MLHNQRALDTEVRGRGNSRLDRQTYKQTLGQLGEGLGLLQTGQRDWRQLDLRALSLSDMEEEGGLGMESGNSMGWEKGD